MVTATAKCRLVKLVVNFLFYFRIDEEEPVGALLLEQCRIQKEEDTGFSLVFVDEPERKYSFVCDSKDECEEWIEALTKASYEYMRNSLIFYRHEIEKITGKLPAIKKLKKNAVQNNLDYPNEAGSTGAVWNFRRN
ncbi:pleckstrin homology domain-containing family J member 1 isoform X3 [Chiloscyllium punctatum]|uniref:pleckstrin homology domain-containing family J member 1 isoform X3 n=1 Tax=Chiloscyllium punctatum TaxID=137246 RepID=UPI003B6377CF